MYRFAPSLSQDLHLENLRVALFNYISAKQSNENFIIRIEDTETENIIHGKDQEILQILNLFQIKYDGLYYQSENLKFHRQLASKLLMDGHAFSCFCTPETLTSKKELADTNHTHYRYDGTCKQLSDAQVLDNENPFVIRIKKPEKSIRFKDLIKGERTFAPEDVDDFVILNVAKIPTHDFACALDDMLHNISVVIRDVTHLSDSAKQILIRQYLGYDKEIAYAHLPNIPELAKTSVNALLEEGYLPSAIANYLMLIGNKTPVEIFSVEEAISWFDISNISKEPVNFEIEKLRQINRVHIKMLDPLELAKFIGFSSREIGELAKIYLDEASTINKIKVKIDTIFSTKNAEIFVEEFRLLKEIAQNLPYYKTFDEFEAALGDKSGLEGESLLKPLRILLTGAQNGPHLSDIYPHIKNYLGDILK